MLVRARTVVAVVAAGTLAVLAGGCGSSKGGPGNGTNATPPKPATTPNQTKTAQKLSLEADDDGGLYFKPTKLGAKAGSPVTLVMENPKTTGKEHGIAIKGNGVDEDGPIVKPGKTATLTAQLKRGRYTFYCDYDGHAKRGMKGTLTIR